MRPARWPKVWSDGIATLALDPNSFCLIAAQQKAWWRVLLPGLWTTGLRMLALGRDEALLFHAGTSLVRRRAGLPIWRGPMVALAASVAANRGSVIELSLDVAGKPETVVVVGRENCDDLRRALTSHA